MSANNPSITASSIVTEIEAILGTPSISTSTYLPWISYAYQKTYQALVNAGQDIKERLFGNYLSVNLANGTAEYTLSTIIPRFGGFIKVEILYGGSGDERVRLAPLRSISNWRIQGNVSTSYRSKANPLYYVFQNTFGIIPTPPASDASSPTLYTWYIRAPYQIDAGGDVIDIPYRFLTPLKDYVQAKAVQKEHEDYSVSAQLERDFRLQLEEISLAASSEYNENEQTNEIEDSSDNVFYDNPFR